MKIGIPKEIKNNENRVGMTPAGVFELVKIYDIFGKLVMTTTKNTISTDNLSDGIYIINITTDNMVITKKITITK